ncbi:MAG: phosphotransferase [Spirochaetaceae bacterium]|nr:phosphotransferase [Spirochaetaceae bacterium]
MHSEPYLCRKASESGNYETIGCNEHYKKAERLEAILENAGISIVPAITFNGKKMQEFQGNYFYIFDWHNGSITDWNNITPEQCWKAGNIQGRIHAIKIGRIEATEFIEPELSAIDWNEYLEKAISSLTSVTVKEVESLLKQNLPLLEYAQTELNKAHKSLPNITTIIDEDMDPKNVMWENGEPVVIDLECLDYGNPVSSAIQLSLQWSGITLCNYDAEKQKSFFQGFLAAYDNGFRDYKSVFGLTYTWIEWLEYNIQRALGACQDKAEQEMGLTEVKNTINRIKYIREIEEKIKENLQLFK